MGNTTLIDLLLSIIQVSMIFWPVFVIFGITVTIQLIRKLYTKQRFQRAGMIDIDRFTGQEFEQYLAVLFEQLGYKTQLTPKQGDFGADIILERNGHHIAVQAKRSSSTIGVNAVQQVVTSMQYYQCTDAMVITNSYFSKQAIALAKANNVTLWDRKQLVSKILTLPQPSVLHAAGKRSVLRPSQPELSTVKPFSMATSVTLPIDMQPAATLQSNEAHPNQQVNCCKTCDAQVSAAVRAYCLEHLEIFGGNIYCFKHQQPFKKQEYVKAHASKRIPTAV